MQQQGRGINLFLQIGFQAINSLIINIFWYYKEINKLIYGNIQLLILKTSSFNSNNLNSNKTRK